MSTSSIPLLRSDLTLERAADGRGWVLQDPALAQRLVLEPTTLAVVRALDRPQSVGELAARLGLERQVVERALALLRRLALLQDAGADQALAAAAAIHSWSTRPLAEVPLLVRPEAAFGCTVCGSCCGCQTLGPVSPRVLDGLRPRLDELRVKLGPGSPGMFVAVPGQRDAYGDPLVVCQLRDGFCVFLDDDGYCILHRDYGWDSKPNCCTVFPYMFVATPRGVAVSLQLECRSYDRARRGPPLTSQLDELRRILGTLPAARSAPARLQLDEELPLSWPDYDALEDQLHDVVDARGDDPLAALLGMRVLVEQRRGIDPAVSWPGSDLATLRTDLDSLVSELDAGLAQLARRFVRNDAEQEVHTGSLDVLAAGVRTLRTELRSILRPLTDPEHRALFGDFVHNRLMGKRLLEAPTVSHGLARLACSWLLIRAVAAQRAKQVKRRHLVTQDLVDAMTLVTFLLHDRDVRHELARHDQAVLGLFHERLPALLAQGDHLPDLQRRVQTYKF